jgi:hypothetical protein
VHSYLESVKDQLIINDSMTVENFREIPGNSTHCDNVFEYTLAQFNYELSYNQIANGINLFLKSQKITVGNSSVRG